MYNTGLQQVLAVWGVLRAGYGYVPIDWLTEAPRLRLLFTETRPLLAIGAAASTAADGGDGGGDTPALATVAAGFNIPYGSFPDGGCSGQ